jgi:beta-phosphoglucomutase-like phosphatase (HAD superfamily)
VTAAPADLADALLERRGWKALFAVVVTGDLGPAKPAPDLYRLALRLLGVEPAVALAVEDSPAGVEAATAAGLRTVGVAPSPPAAARLEQAGAAATVVHLGELPGLVA